MQFPIVYYMDTLTDSLQAMPNGFSGISEILPFVDNLLSLALLIFAVWFFIRREKAQDETITNLHSARLEDLKSMQTVLQGHSTDMMKHSVSSDSLREAIERQSDLIRSLAK